MGDVIQDGCRGDFLEELRMRLYTLLPTTTVRLDHLLQATNRWRNLLFVMLPNHVVVILAFVITNNNILLVVPIPVPCYHLVKLAQSGLELELVPALRLVVLYDSLVHHSLL